MIKKTEIYTFTLLDIFKRSTVLVNNESDINSEEQFFNLLTSLLEIIIFFPVKFLSPLNCKALEKKREKKNISNESEYTIESNERIDVAFAKIKQERHKI